MLVKEAQCAEAAGQQRPSRRWCMWFLAPMLLCDGVCTAVWWRRKAACFAPAGRGIHDLPVLWRCLCCFGAKRSVGRFWLGRRAARRGPGARRARTWWRPAPTTAAAPWTAPAAGATLRSASSAPARASAPRRAPAAGARARTRCAVCRGHCLPPAHAPRLSAVSFCAQGMDCRGHVGSFLASSHNRDIRS